MPPIETGGETMLEHITTALGTILDWCGTVLTSVTTDAGELSALMPLLAVGIGISVLFLGVKVIKSFTWGA